MMIKFFYLVLAMSIMIPNEEKTSLKNPKKALMRSIFPGMGQIYNEKYAKAAFFIVLETYCTTALISKYKSVDNSSSLDSDLIRDRNLYAWMVMGVYILNLIDAYVDAHLSTFPEE